MAEKAFVIMVIENVEKHPCLWDPASVSYGKRDQLEKAWQEISIECGKPPNFVRDKWKNVRTGFLRSLRDYPENSKMMPAKRKPFYLHGYMQFLLPSIMRSDPPTSSSNETQSNFALRNSEIQYSDVHHSEIQHSEIQQSEIQNSDIQNSECEVVKIEDSSNSEIDFEELEKYGNTQLSPKNGYFSHFATTTFKDENSQQKEIEISEPPGKRYKILMDDEQFTQSREELALLSFFKGVAPDVLSLSIQNQRFFKRKVVELVDDLHKEDKSHMGMAAKCTSMYEFYPSSSNNALD